MNPSTSQDSSAVLLPLRENLYSVRPAYQIGPSITSISATLRLSRFTIHRYRLRLIKKHTHAPTSTPQLRHLQHLHAIQLTRAPSQQCTIAYVYHLPERFGTHSRNSRNFSVREGHGVSVGTRKGMAFEKLVTYDESGRPLHVDFDFSSHVI
ncbi:hypothetical protein BV22DRAFT_926680 [Leucogyrophana mollusca]|uniref:Uncharacterized protein n=1 Tax=Leucogyrophana mollusca TaxID=85980 RepID=A0ACB8AWR9_9AGAM|nr:hypothetical protein BV22DRAFT_926680 [Leucogyrophana mollusca]